MSCAMLNFDVKCSFMCIMSNVYGNSKWLTPNQILILGIATHACLVICHEDPITWCLVSQNYDNVNVYSSCLPCQQIMCRISNYRSKRVIYFWTISVNFHWAISAPIISRHSRWIILKCKLHCSCAEIQPFVQRRIVMMSARPARCRGQLPRVMFFRPAVAKNTFVSRGGGGHSPLKWVGGCRWGVQNLTLSQTARRTKTTPCHNIPC